MTAIRVDLQFALSLTLRCVLPFRLCKIDHRCPWAQVLHSYARILAISGQEEAIATSLVSPCHPMVESDTGNVEGQVEADNRCVTGVAVLEQDVCPELCDRQDFEAVRTRISSDASFLGFRD